MPAAHARFLRSSLLGLAFGLMGPACERPVDVPAPAPVARSDEETPRASAERNPLQDLRPTDTGDDTFVGVVEESLPAGGYTYLRVATDGGDRWVATMGTGAPVGHRVHVKNMGTRHDFHSKRLGRRFEELAFGIVREA